MSKLYTPSFSHPLGALIEIPSVGITLAAKAGAPTNSIRGYAPSCLYQDTTNGDFYRNTGTLASSTFLRADVDIDLSGLLATAAEINRSSDMSTRVVEVALAGSATLSITEADHDGKTIYVLKTDGWNATLPVPVAGMKFRIVIGATIATASTIKSVAGTHIMIGHALMGNNSDNTVVDWPATAADTFDTINLLGTSNSTGGMAGQVITIEAMSSTVWLVEIRGDASGTEATPFENTVT